MDTSQAPTMVTETAFKEMRYAPERGKKRTFDAASMTMSQLRADLKALIPEDLGRVGSAYIGELKLPKSLVLHSICDVIIRSTGFELRRSFLKPSQEWQISLYRWSRGEGQYRPVLIGRGTSDSPELAIMRLIWTFMLCCTAEELQRMREHISEEFS